YYFRTIKPGPYPWRNGPTAWRPAHIHGSVSGPAIAARLVPQMYFEGAPLIPKCPLIRPHAAPAAAPRRIGRRGRAPRFRRRGPRRLTSPSPRRAALARRLAPSERPPPGCGPRVPWFLAIRRARR
ncbi:hypothetical protein KIP72_05605, partial [Pseudomonas aeruginosa]|nr:hypothetical protein [Pseudomonas aeruginosa]